MRLTTVLAINAGAAIGFFVAKQLLSPESDAQIQRLPQAAREPLVTARQSLERGRQRLAIAWNEGRAARDEAEQELRRQYYEKTHSKPSSPADGLQSLL